MSEQNPIIHFADVIRVRREQLDKSQADVGRELGLLSGEFIGMVETGARRIPLDRVPALAAALQLDGPELCKLAISERHPVLYRELFGTRSAS